MHAVYECIPVGLNALNTPIVIRDKPEKIYSLECESSKSLADGGVILIFIGDHRGRKRPSNA